MCVGRGGGGHLNGTVDLFIFTNATVSLVILVVAIVVSSVEVRPNCTVDAIVIGTSIVVGTVALSIVPFVWLR